MRFVIVTGMSGAGKSSALKTLEDAGYFCVDNLPVALLDKFADMLLDETAKIENVALGIDIRNGGGIGELAYKLKEIEAAGIKYEILYLNASNRILLKRYKETRRNHPLSRDGRVEDGIAKEREIMKFLQDQATYVIDTSQLLTRELKEEIDRIFVDGEEGERFQIAVVSFGFKHGIPADVDLVFDVRFLPNPYYDLNLRPLTGNDKPIQDFVMRHEESVEFLDNSSLILLENDIAYLIISLCSTLTEYGSCFNRSANLLVIVTDRCFPPVHPIPITRLYLPSLI